MLSVQFKDHRSDEFNLKVTDIGRRQRAEEQVDEYEIPYRNGNLIIHSNKYNSYKRDMEFVLKNKEKTSLINAWLTGRGQLRTSIDDGGFFYASVIGQIGIEKLSKLFNSFPVTFKVDPFFYLDAGQNEIILTTTSTIFNPGTVYSDPYIKIIGSGNVTLTINSNNYNFTGIDGYIEIDSELKICYKDTLNQGEKMSGDFPLLDVGNNYIAWAGTVTGIEIIPRWREL